MRKRKVTDYGKSRLDEALPMICLYWGVSREEILSKTRLQNIVCAKHSLRYLLSRDSALTLSEIGSLTNCDHATVLHSIKMFERYSSQEFQFIELKAIMDGVLTYKKFSSKNFRVSEVLNSKLSTKEKVGMLDVIYYEN